MSSKEFNAYIDESGDEGFKEGSSQWFIISSVVVGRDNDQNVATAINDIKYRLWQTQTTQPLHWVKLDHKRKRVAISEVAKRNFVLFSSLWKRNTWTGKDSIPIMSTKTELNSDGQCIFMQLNF